jgi:hypothetical protein
MRRAPQGRERGARGNAEGYGGLKKVIGSGAFCSGDSEKLHNTFDAFEHSLLRFIAFGHLGLQPLSAGRKQPFEGRADSRIGIKVSCDDAKSSVIPIRSRPVIAANCIGKALDQGGQEKALRLLRVSKKVLPTIHN